VIYFVDTSALVKRYISEAGSEYIRGLLATADNFFYQSFLTPLEITSAFYRRRRMNELSSEELTVALQAYADHSHKEYILTPYSEVLLNTAGTLLARHPQRTLDAIQLAAALGLQRTFPAEASPLTSMSADNRLIAVARHENLQTDNPNNHP
jgi:predicted nucleic acid-binding protein